MKEQKKNIKKEKIIVDNVNHTVYNMIIGSDNLKGDLKKWKRLKTLKFI